MENKEHLESEVEKLRKYFLSQLTILKGTCDGNLSSRAFETRIVIASACSTGTAIYQLGESIEYFYAEMMMLGRSFIEKLINFCYLQVCDDTEYKKFLIHPLYRAFHNSDRSKYTPKSKLGIIYSGRENFKNEPQALEALKLFSETNPHMHWSNLTIDQKVTLISEKTKIRTEFFLMNTLTIYSNASEALHGTLYGCALPTGAFTPGIDHSNKGIVINNLYKNVALLYVQLGSMIHEIIELLSGAQNEDLLKSTRNNEKLALSIMKIIFDKDEEHT